MLKANKSQAKEIKRLLIQKKTQVDLTLMDDTTQNSRKINTVARMICWTLFCTQGFCIIVRQVVNVQVVISWTGFNASLLLNFKRTARTILAANLRTMFKSFQNFLIPQIPKMCDPILVTVLKMQPHYSQSSRENATPSSGTSPVASYKEVPPPPPGFMLGNW